MSCRAAVIVTGTEVLTGRVTDRNGPWLAEQLRLIGVDIASITVVGDRPDDLHDALARICASGVDLVFTSGGLGPTADDLTARLVGEFQGRQSSLDPALEGRIAAIIERLSAGRGWRTDPSATAAATRKQAMVPAGASVLEPVGTAPGLVVPPSSGRAGPPVVVLPGPPRELQGMWRAVLDDPLVQAALSARTELRQRTMRLWNVPESELASTLRTHETALASLEITTCLHDGELEVVTRFGPSAQEAYDDFEAAIRAAHGRALFSVDGSTVDDVVATGLIDRGLTIATAESCTAGLLAARLADRPGSSEYLLGGVVAYSNAAKASLLGVPAELIERVGAVSAEVAAAMAAGARERFGADIGVGITGIAGPGGGTPDKPVGRVEVCVERPDRTVARQLNLFGARPDVRARSVVIALHLVRRLLVADAGTA